MWYLIGCTSYTLSTCEVMITVLWIPEQSVLWSKTLSQNKQPNKKTKPNSKPNFYECGVSSQKVLIWFSYFLNASLDSVNKINKNKQTNETETQSIKRAQWLKALAANCDDLSYILQAHMVEGKSQLTYDVLWLPAVSHGMCLYPTHKINNQMLDKSRNSALASDSKVFSFVTWN